MIYEFKFSNFRSYKSEATIDFSAKPITEFKSSVIETGSGGSLLPVCAIYGPNGGGKSSVLLAIKKMRDIIIEPVLKMQFMMNKNQELTDSPLDDLNEDMKIETEESDFYKWDDVCKDKPTNYSILFQVNRNKYRYELSVFKNAIAEENLFLEKLDSGELESVFERDSDGIYLSESIDKIDIEKLNEGLPLISYIFLFKNFEVIDEVIKYFLDLQIVNFDTPRQDRKIMTKIIEKDKNRIINVVRSMGMDICDIRIERDIEGKVKEVYTKHKINDEMYKELKFNEESSGTRKVFSILPVILDGLDKGKFFIIDELDAKLHPVLLRRIIELFTSSETNKRGAQLLFTSHDMTTMSNEIFRRDEIWFSAINGYNESVLYSLVEFKKENGDKTRKDENYSKRYLEGRYGADPYMKRLQNWEVVE